MDIQKQPVDQETQLQKAALSQLIAGRGTASLNSVGTTFTESEDVGTNTPAALVDSNSAAISLQPTATGTGFITSLNGDALASEHVSASKKHLTKSPFATTEASFLTPEGAPAATSDSGEPLGGGVADDTIGASRQLRLQSDLPLPFDVLHPEVKNPDFANCTSHSDAISTGECNTWCALNPEECTNGFVSLIERTCHERRPDLPVCDCLRAMQKVVYDNGRIPLNIIPNPILNSQMTQAILNGKSINERCGAVDAAQAKAQKITLGKTLASAPSSKERFFLSHEKPPLWLQAILVLLVLYFISRR